MVWALKSGANWRQMARGKSLRHDSVLLMFLLYAFTVAIYMPASSSIIGVHNASVAIIDEDLQPPVTQTRRIAAAPGVQSATSLAL